jgi:acetylornithine deacetylase/succinyl-diaminopimelate desuccinylase-like protein
MPVSARQIVDLLGAMVAIESVTPSLIPTGSGEAKIAAFIAGWLDRAGVEVQTVAVRPGRTNVVATLRGTGGGPALCLIAHSDTVGYAGWPDEALVPRVDGDRMYGLGAADDKAGCAAAMLVLAELARSGARLRGDLMIACVADKEGFSIGAEHLARRGGIDAAIVLEPQPAHELVVEHQGLGWLDVITRGVAAPGQQPQVGVDAIVHLAEVITELRRLDRDKFRQHPSLLNGRTVVHAGTIAGGTDYATYPTCARVGIEIGIQPGEHLCERIAEIEAIFASVARREPGFSGKIVVRHAREPFVAQGHEALQAVVARAMTAVLGREPKVTGMNGWTDAAVLQAAGIPTLLIGSAGGSYHAPGEWVSISELVRLCEILERTAAGYLAAS